MDPLALDGDESGAGVGRGDFEQYFVAGPIFAAVEFEVEFRIALQVAGDVGGTGYREFDAAQLAAVGTDQFERITSRSVAGQEMIAARRRQGEWRTVQLGFLLDRLIGIGPVALPDQRRHVAAFVQHRFDAVHSGRR